MMKRLMLAVGLVLLLVAGAASASVIGVDLSLVPPSDQANRLELTLTASALFITRHDTDYANLAGNVLASLSVNFDPTPLDAEVIGLEFTGGGITLSDLSFTLDYGFLGTLQANGTGIGGTLDTPTPPGVVTGGAFAGSDHVVILNQGTIVSGGTGIIGGMADSLAVDLGTGPIIATTNQWGSLVVSAPTPVGGQAICGVTLSMPLQYDEEIYNQEGVVVSATLSGMIEAHGQFSVSTMPGDADIDGDVDLDDFVLLKQSFGTMDGATWQMGDFTGEGAVDLDDFVLLKQNFGAAAIPEPTTVCLLALGGLAALPRRHWQLRGTDTSGDTC